MTFCAIREALGEALCSFAVALSVDWVFVSEEFWGLHVEAHPWAAPG